MSLVHPTPAPFQATLPILTLGAGVVRFQPQSVGLITSVGAPPGATKKGVPMNPKKRVRPTASLKPVLASRNGHHLGAFPFFCYTGPQAGASFLKPKWVSKSQLLDNVFWPRLGSLPDLLLISPHHQRDPPTGIPAGARRQWHRRHVVATDGSRQAKMV